MWSNKYTWLSLTLFLLALIYFLSPILMPFVISLLLAYLGNPLVNKLSAFKLPRSLGALIVFLLFLSFFFLLLFLLIPLVEKQIYALMTQIPNQLNKLQNVVFPWLEQHTDLAKYLNLSSLQSIVLKNWQQAGNAATYIIKALSRSGYSFFVSLINYLLIPIVTFYLLRDWDKLIREIEKLIPHSKRALATQLTSDCNQVIAAFFRGQLLVMLSLSFYYSIILTFMGIDYSLLIGLLVGILSIIPYVGSILGIIISMLVVLMQFQDWFHLAYVSIVFLIGHLLESYVLSPMLVGDRIGLHPVVVIFAVLAGSHLLGFFGILLALPMAAVIKVFLLYLRQSYLDSETYRLN